MVLENYLYIDKTRRIFELVKDDRYFFLSRPRRFGKSLLISTLEEFFLGNRDLFKGLWLEKADYGWPKHPVISLNFSDLDIDSATELKQSLALALDELAEDFGIDLSKYPTPGSKLKRLVKNLSEKNSVVILVDEYDYPLLNNLSNLKVAEANRKVLRNFFSVVKSLDRYLRAIFITGVSKFSKTSIFSGLNNLNDISIDPVAADLLGYTEVELDNYLEPYIAQLAEKEQKTVTVIRQEITQWYNGYRFSEAPIRVYNPFSVLYLLKKNKFTNYWFESGTPSYLVDLLAQQNYTLENIENAELSRKSLGTFDIGNLPLITLLFQTGYLTIHDYNSKDHTYKLDYPNKEVRESLAMCRLATSNATIPHYDYPH